MPRVNDGGGNAGFHIDGVYEKLLTGRCRERRQLDPRLELWDMSPLERDVWSWLRAERVWQAEGDLAERLAVGEPFELPRWYFGGRSIPRDDSWPVWLRPCSDVKTVRVFADDRVLPVYDDSEEAFERS